jgi:hypothetical protein
MIFRIDDVSVNTDLEKLKKIVNTIGKAAPQAKFLFAISPLVHDVSKERVGDHERAFPRLLSAHSDHREMFSVRRLGLPEFKVGYSAQLASHGLVHVDHRLMGREAQELSIVTSCALVDTSTFVPPFNKYNKDTIDVCEEHGIDLVKFEHGWRHVRFNDFEPTHELYYLHTHDVDIDFLNIWLRKK